MMRVVVVVNERRADAPLDFDERRKPALAHLIRQEIRAALSRVVNLIGRPPLADAGITEMMIHSVPPLKWNFVFRRFQRGNRARIAL